jgi:3-deoxy-7-phosphoheptulonate synthase
MPLTRLAICFESEAAPASLRQCLALLGFAGPSPRWRWHAPGLLTAVLDRAPAPEVLARLARVAGVRRIVDRSALYAGPRRSVPLGRAAVGAGGFAVIAGPCSVEGRSQVTEIAALVAEHGGDALRGGAWKPRTSPWSFGGLGEPGLEYLAEAGARFGLPVVTEVLDANDLDLVARYADVLQIGARNMQNFRLLEAVGECEKPVLLKRGLVATLDELLLAAEYVLAAGNPDVILCERGIRTFARETRNTLDLAAIPLLKEKTHLPVIADPSHGTGLRALVPPLAKAALAAGADGLLIEVHPDPASALSDGPQSLTFDGFAELMRDLGPLARVLGRSLGPTA